MVRRSTFSGSRQHKDFDEYLISKEEWNEIQPGTSELAVSLSAHEYLEERTSSLLKRLKWVSNHIGVTPHHHQAKNLYP
ncbi:hypothetical protein N7917_29800 [Bacillus sp. OR9]|nr:hypothetical protein [Bacillus sp. OR9]